jgi:hypothetical protein
MKRLLLLLPVLLGCAGCQSAGFWHEPAYYKVVTTNLNGDLVSSWVSEGAVARREGGYTFKAIERQVEHPPVVYRYPLGWHVHIAAPKTVVYRIAKPEWISKADPLAVADAAEDGGQVAPPVRLAQPPQSEAGRVR